MLTGLRSRQAREEDDPEGGLWTTRGALITCRRVLGTRKRTNYLRLSLIFTHPLDAITALPQRHSAFSRYMGLFLHVFDPHLNQ
jgi:hypothetical protein